MKKSIFSVIVLVMTTTTALAQEEGFWVARDIRQGMTEQTFLSSAEEGGFAVKKPLPNSDIQAVNIDGMEYWLVFCAGRLTYASWSVDEVAAFHKSLDTRINGEGFRLSRFGIESSYNDRSGDTLSNMTLKLERAGTPYSITYQQFAQNTQIILEDVGYDDSYGCEGDN